MKNTLDNSLDEPTTSVAQTNTALPSRHAPVAEGSPPRVTFRAFAIGLVFTIFIAWLNCFMATKYGVHMVGGIQMPFSALVILMVFALGTIGLRKVMASGSRLPFSPTELLTIYSMLIFAALVSTPGADNLYLVGGPALFYFSTPENGWASLFYKYVPSWFAPGWNGTTYQKEIIDPLYLGGLSFSQIPWHAWVMMLTGWAVFLALIYSLMFFTALLFRKQWTQREALSFPLVEVPVQMASVEGNSTNAPPFWTNRMMWIGLILACSWHFFFGMNSLYPEWPIIPVNVTGGMAFSFPDKPFSVIPPFKAEIFLGAIGLAYLLTREISFSFWFFFLFMLLSYAGMASLGKEDLLLSTGGLQGRPNFIVYQAVGGWAMMAIMLFWTAREYLGRMFREAFSRNRGDEDEPFSPRFMVFGFLLSFIGLLAWSWFAGINVLVALTFFAIFLMTSLVISRIVIEGGFLFPQPPFSTLQTMSQTMFGSSIGASSLTKLGFIQPMILLDMRTSVLPAFLHTMKMAEVLRLDRKNLRRLLLCGVIALAVTTVVTTATSLQVLYSQGGLASYGWFSSAASTSTFAEIAAAIKTPTGVNPGHWGWIALGAALVWLMVLGRSRFLWFPFHPLGYLVASAYPIPRLWFPFFLGWLTKTLVMKYGGSDTYVSLRPFMIGLILGNALAMIFWTLIVFWIKGTPVGYWPA